jgi:two-component system, chemotaxis family, sensor kinase CheA
VPTETPGGDDFLARFMDDYHAESEEHLTTVRRILLEIEPRAGTRTASPDLLNELFRSFHSLKGLSGMVELREAELLAHHMESYLRLLGTQSVVLSSEGIGELIDGTHALEQVIAARRQGQPLPDVEPVLARLIELSGSSQPSAPVARPVEDVQPPVPDRWIVRFVPSQALAARGINVDRIRADLRKAGQIERATPRVDKQGGISFEFVVAGALDALDAEEWRERGVTFEPGMPPAPVVAPDAEGASAAAAGTTSAAALPSHFVRVDLARLDELMRLIGDLVISRARLAEALARVPQDESSVEWRAVHEHSASIERHLRDLREGVVRVRLVPVGEIFRRMPFVVRDLAREADKKVRLEVVGEDTEIDKFLIERMMDPMLHLVRNAVSHAFETTAERRAAGKSEEGTLTLSAAAVGEVVVIEVSDDGRGIDTAAVAKRARAARLPVPEGTLDSAALLEILCAAGFSTREEADRASGRGVGMSVVMTTVRELGGSLTLDTVPGQGSRFAIELPLTLAITDAIIGVVGDQTFAVPQSAVREVIEIDPGAVRIMERHELVPYRGGVLPLLRLTSLFGLKGRPRPLLHALVAGQGTSAVGLVVDRIVGQREIVVRALSDPLVKVPGVSGATDLGDGRVVLILDLPALVARTPARARSFDATARDAVLPSEGRPG